MGKREGGVERSSGRVQAGHVTRTQALRARLQHALFLSTKPSVRHLHIGFPSIGPRRRSLPHTQQHCNRESADQPQPVRSVAAGTSTQARRLAVVSAFIHSHSSPPARAILARPPARQRLHVVCECMCVCVCECMPDAASLGPSWRCFCCVFSTASCFARASAAFLAWPGRRRPARLVTGRALP